MDGGGGGGGGWGDGEGGMGGGGGVTYIRDFMHQFMLSNQPGSCRLR